MKWSSILVLSALAIVSMACEKHPASHLPKKHATGEHHAETKHEEKHAAEPAAAAKPEAAKHDTEAKPGDAPKFFPETK